MWDETYELTYRVIAEEELAEAVCPREAPIYERATPEHYDHINGVSPLAPVRLLRETCWRLDQMDVSKGGCWMLGPC